MTPTATFEQGRRRSSAIVIAVTFLALLLGWVIKTSTENRTRDYTYQGVSARIPAGWLVQQGGEAGEQAAIPNQIVQVVSSDDPNLVFMTWDPLHPEQRYSVSLYPSSADTSLPSTASVRNLQRAQTLNTYHVIEETPVTVDGQDGYKVTFAYVNPGGMSDVPTVVNGADYYFANGDQTLVVTLEVDDGEIAGALAPFLKFLNSLSVGG